MSGETREITEASQLGWPPGHWPENFTHDGAEFVRDCDVRHGDELVAVVYRAKNGRELEVLND